MNSAGTLRMAIDIGGTFTDTVLEANGKIIASAKTLTTHGNPAEGAINGAKRVMETSGHHLDEVSVFIHGTTLATNALIEKKGATVATVATEGFRDILEIAYERRYEQYDINLEKPDLLVPRERSLTISERVSAEGSVLVEMEQKAIDGLLGNIEASGAKSIAICLMHSYANPSHEQRLKDAIAGRFPELPISVSSEVSPEAREFDRLCTTVANAYIQPLMGSYLLRLSEKFAAEGLNCPILMMTAGGGMCTLDTAARFPIRLVESGPAGGAILASRIAAQADLKEVLSFDMGGTTAKLCLIDKALPQTSRQFEIARASRFIRGSGMPVRIPVIEMIEIGAGGGSIASVDGLGRLSVGPRSAGSEPGPVAFGKGGAEPTVTDSDIAMGYIIPEVFAEGHVKIDPMAAKKALKRKVGNRIGLDAIESADGVGRIVVESMASAARMHAVESGKDLSERTMIAFGGNGPLHATRVARSAGVSRIVIPPDPGVGSAVGFLFAPISFEMVRSRYTLLEHMDSDSINLLLNRMETDALSVVRLGGGDAPTRKSRSAFMRYSGQGHEIEIALPDGSLADSDIPRLSDAFEKEYRRQYARPVPGMKIEILNWAVGVSTMTEPPGKSPGEMRENRPLAKQSHRILCDQDGVYKEADCFNRADLRPGDHIEGPALVLEAQTTTLISSDIAAHVDGIGNLVLARKTNGVD